MSNAPAPAWQALRAATLNAKLMALAGKSEITYAFVPSPESGFLKYLPDNLSEEIAAWSPEPCRLVPASAGGEPPDIVIATTHVADYEASWLWQLRQESGEHPLYAIWMWDNHFDHDTNSKAAMAADFVFPSHHYDAAYLCSPAAVLSAHVPACSAQWTRGEAEQLFDAVGHRERRHKLLVNYAKYDFATERNHLIDEIGKHVPEAEMLLMSQADRSRYFSKGRAERFAEWAAYKTTIIIPMINDLSTRFFDALLAGMVPIVPRGIPDLDVLLSAEEQRELGIVRLASYAIDDVRAAVRLALARFDEGGLDGAIARHRFVAENHMVVNRITSMLYALYLDATHPDSIRFRDGPLGPGLYEDRADAAPAAT